MLKREIKITADGSPTLYIPDWDEGYHSKHGALQEALHVFIENGYKRLTEKSHIKILEYGFGTGLNALLTLLMAKNTATIVEYHTLEKFPITPQEIENLHIAEQIATFLHIDKEQTLAYFQHLHLAAWEKDIEITANFSLRKIQADFKTVSLEENQFDLIYFDAFGKRVQPELWTEKVFEKAYKFLNPNGLLTTYACNGTTKRAMNKIGFQIEKLAGPPGKREMINAWKK